MMQVSPGKCEDDQLDEPVRRDALEMLKRDFGQQALVQQEEDEWQQQEDDGTTGAVQN